MATIHVIQGPDKGRTHSLPARETRVGREAEDLQLNDPTVSREHVRLFPRNGEWIIEDLGSANGTYVNGVRLRRTLPLRQGDQVRMGSTLLVFGGSGPAPVTNGTLDIDEDGNLVDSAIITTVPGNADSVIMPTPEAGDRAIGNLRHLYNLIGTISTIFDAELLANRVLDHVCELFHPDRGFVVLIDPAGRLAPVAVRDPHRDLRLRHRGHRPVHTRRRRRPHRRGDWSDAPGRRGPRRVRRPRPPAAPAHRRPPRRTPLRGARVRHSRDGRHHRHSRCPGARPHR